MRWLRRLLRRRRERAHRAALLEVITHGWVPESQRACERAWEATP